MLCDVCVLGGLLIIAMHSDSWYDRLVTVLVFSGEGKFECVMVCIYV